MSMHVVPLFCATNRPAVTLEEGGRQVELSWRETSGEGTLGMCTGIGYGGGKPHKQPTNKNRALYPK